MATEFQAYGGAVPVFFTTRDFGGSIPVRVVNRVMGGAMPIRTISGAVGGGIPVWSSDQAGAMPVFIVGPGSTTPIAPPEPPPVATSYVLRDDGTSFFLRPDGTSKYVRP